MICLYATPVTISFDSILIAWYPAATSPFTHANAYNNNIWGRNVTQMSNIIFYISKIYSIICILLSLYETHRGIAYWLIASHIFFHIKYCCYYFRCTYFHLCFFRLALCHFTFASLKSSRLECSRNVDGIAENEQNNSLYQVKMLPPCVQKIFNAIWT